MFDIRADIKKDKLYCIINGNITKSELISCVEKLKNESDKLSDGFIFMKDIGGIETDDSSSIHLLNNLINKHIYPRALVVITISSKYKSKYSKKTKESDNYQENSNKYSISELKNYINTISFNDQLN